MNEQPNERYFDMKGLSIWQPWATLLITDKKIYETRSWETKYRGFVAIQASAQKAAKLLKDFNNTPGYETLIENILTVLQEQDVGLWKYSYEDLKDLFLKEELLPLGAIVGTAKLVACHEITEEFISKLSPCELAFGDFTPGRFAWEFTNKRPCKPIPYKGAQGLFKVRLYEKDVVRI